MATSALPGNTMPEQTEINVLIPFLISLILVVVVFFIIMPIAVYRFYRKERGYPSGESFGLMMVIEIAFIFLTIAYFDIMPPLIFHLGGSDFIFTCVIIAWFILPFAILWWQTARIRKAKKDNSGNAPDNNEST